MIVAIDGPAGSGKGTIAKILSDRLNLLNLDTGAMYRCVALACIRNKIGLDEEEKIINEVDNLVINFKKVDDVYKTFLNGEDVSKEIRENDVSKLVSQVSSIKGVRIKLVDLQRKIADNKDVVLEGRDIGTVVFPNADLKVYLDARPEVRAMRRYKENLEKGMKCSFEEILENINFRDYNDMHKEMGALKKAEDAVYIDSSEMTIDEVSSKIINLITNLECWRKENV